MTHQPIVSRGAGRLLLSRSRLASSGLFPWGLPLSPPPRNSLSRLSSSASNCAWGRRKSPLPAAATPAVALGFLRPKHVIPLSSPSSGSRNQRAAHTIGPPSSSPQTAPTTAASYSPPTSGLLARLPASWVPYAELIRIDKPAGTYYLYFPCLFSTLLAAPLTLSSADPAGPLAVTGTAALFLAGAIVMRGAGCSINDLWDRNLDPHVARTRHRPLARGALSPPHALAYVAAQLLAGLAVLLQLPQPACFYYATPSLLLVAAYPLAKRVTYYPQFVLGLTFSWGAVMGFPALGIDLLAEGNTGPFAAAALLYTSNVAWTILYDMIYAHMDIRDDAKAGIKSIALKHDPDTKKILTAAAAVQIGLLAAAGTATGAGPAFFIGSCGGAALTLGYMIRKVDLKSVQDCWWWFANGSWITGGVISLGLGADYLLKYFGEDPARIEAGEKEAE
ncbi:para-hydroxybenzoate-polyprenyltransferase [Durotheca rogersii]|uniref:para-hydroxybenzoate-polyprenyltransferase n=1 Tax=Durotheca rogersii TaxID=419775 RepID=UPI00221FA290|nr:para-hydroxybenzoate-polyprenyltransferase [Durotheca rogersii]KAI5864006.1 para-hydroxybenzoate-polyprenyltransferase [Durotheca rogersii]